MQFSGEGGRLRPRQLQETIPTTENKTGLWRFLTPVFREKISPCRLACPLENGIPYWMHKIRQGDWPGAWQIMQEYNPFPAITGHVCYRFCEEKCHRGFWDEAVACSEVEKAIGLWRHRHYRPGTSSRPGGRERGQKDKKVAIVGSGPAGLSAAYYLRQQGMAVTIFEKLPLAGGLLATGIPEYRLPRHILLKELEILEAEGVVFQVGLAAGGEVDLAELQGDFDAVLLAVGAQHSRRLQIRGEELPGVTGALEFLRDLHLGRLDEVTGHVVVVGGGNAAMDAACLAKLRGARDVTLLYRRSREEMPAHPEESKAAAAAGVKFVFQTVLQEICGGKYLQKVLTRRVAPARRGERLQVLPLPVEELPCDLLIVAAGQESVLTELASSLQTLPAIEEAGSGDSRDSGSSGDRAGGGVGDVGNIVGGDEGGAAGDAGKDVHNSADSSGAARSFLSEDKIVLVAGDALTGPTNVAAAIGSGRKAALMLLRALKIYPEPENIPGIAFPLQGPLQRQAEAEAAAVSFESLNPVLYPRQKRQVTAEQEADRCFSCGTCNSCGVCWAFCPEPAIEERDGSFHILLDYCKGCGICVTECPAGVLALEEVPWHET